jgi:hypothetical protein
MIKPLRFSKLQILTSALGRTWQGAGELLQIVWQTLMKTIEILAETLGYLQYSMSFIPEGRSHILHILISLMFREKDTKETIITFSPLFTRLFAKPKANYEINVRKRKREN